jgi:hypothetical protein
MIATENSDAIDVPVYQLDEYLYANKIEYVDLVKIDVEGFEPNVIDGMQSYIKNEKIGAILIEFNNYWLEENGCSAKILYTRITELGFKSQSPLDLSRKLQNIFFTRK